MKSLTEKIIEEVYQFAADSEDANLKQQVEALAGKLEKRSARIGVAF